MITEEIKSKLEVALVVAVSNRESLLERKKNVERLMEVFPHESGEKSLKLLKYTIKYFQCVEVLMREQLSLNLTIPEDVLRLKRLDKAINVLSERTSRLINSKTSTVQC
jgi:hypothetical protein